MADREGGALNTSRDVTTKAGQFYVCISVIRSSSQWWKQSNPQYLEGRVVYTHPGFFKLCENILHRCGLLCAGHEGWVIWIVVSLQLTPDFQNIHIRQIVLMQLLSMWEDRFLVFPILPLPQNFLTKRIIFLPHCYLLCSVNVYFIHWQLHVYHSSFLYDNEFSHFMCKFSYCVIILESMFLGNVIIV